jgi:hypothetical protein
MAAATSSSTNPLWVTLLVGLAGAVLTLFGVLITLWWTSRQETKRQEARLRAEETRLLNVEGRAAIAAYLAAATAFEDAARIWPRKEEQVVRHAKAQLDLALAAVQITCSVEVAGRASGMGLTAELVQMQDEPERSRERSETLLKFKSRHHALIRAVRDELGLNEPTPGEERSKSWLASGLADDSSSSSARR